MARMLRNDLNNKGPGYFHDEVRQKLLESLRPLAREFPSSWVVDRGKPWTLPELGTEEPLLEK
jgi:hypothetical protein